jgi:hypothetical protein
VKDDIEHGLSAYRHGLCRCDVCRAAGSANSRERKARLAARRPGEPRRARPAEREPWPVEVAPSIPEPVAGYPRPSTTRPVFPPVRAARSPRPVAIRPASIGRLATLPTRRPVPAASVVPFGFPEPSPHDATVLALRRYLAGIGPSPSLLAAVEARRRF